jgi:2-phospho-L-lactate guanylyltransferase
VRIVLVASKQLAFAKTRLAVALPAAAERAALATAMYRDVLSAALAARSADRVAVVTSDPSLLEIAQANGALTIDEEFPRGLNAAVRLATARLTLLGATSICTVLSDIPMTDCSDIDDAFAALPSPGPGVVLVPSRDFSGTNMLVRTPPGVIDTQFGRLSLVRHRNDCRSRDIPCEILRLVRPALDIDLPSDLIEFARTPALSHTYNHIARLGLLHG